MKLETLVDIIRENAVVGAGGAGFPTYAKLDKRADTIILNCAECEPLLKLHRQLLESYAYEILYTLDVIADTLEADNVIIALKGSYKSVIEAVELHLDSFKKARIGILPEVYPAGDELVVVYETTGRVVPTGGIPILVGTVVLNVETVYNIYNALNNKEPVTDKYVTVAGEVKKPLTLKVPIGTQIKDLVKLAGGTTIDDYAVIVGGPMTGNLASMSEMVTKTTNAVLIMPQDHHIVKKRKSKVSIDMKRAMSACCQCRMCTDLCPRNLLGHPIEPHEFMRVATSGDTRKIQPYINTMFCSGCGVCEMYACMQNLSPRALIAECKAGLKKNGVAIPRDAEFSGVSPKRAYKKVPMQRLISRLGLVKYNKPAPFEDVEYSPAMVRISLSQHVGAPACAIVKKGDKVIKGQLIGSFDKDKLGVGVHASINGVVTDVNNKFITIRK